jgi:Holliday junction resolvase RusA-like endonuclease
LADTIVLMQTVSFTVHGKPATKGSTRSFVPRRGDGSLVRKPDGSPVVVTKDDSDRGVAWSGDVAKACALAMIDAGVGIVRHAPVIIALTFYFPRNKGHFGTGRNAGVLKDSAPEHPATRPDVDKLVRAMLDALKGTAYVDDGQVIELHARKLYGDPTRAEVEVEALVPEPALALL